MGKYERAILQLTCSEGQNGGARVDWTLLEGQSKYLATVFFEMAYQNGTGTFLEFREESRAALNKCASFAFLAIALPLLLLEHDSVCVETPFSWTDADMLYWRNALRGLGFDSSRLEVRGGGQEWKLQFQQPPIRPDRIALFYGGGLESNTALSALVDRKPLLFVVEGPLWMNNNTDADVGIKRNLEQRLCDRFGLEIIYARTNARWLVAATDTLMNHYCTGGLFYWLAAAAALSEGIGQFYIGQELEYTLIRDRLDMSLTPERLFWSWHAHGPMLVPILGWAASVELLDRLKDTEFLEYVYSCFRNTGKRWCGECTKCYRVSEWCRRLGIPPERLGLEVPVNGTREGSQLYRLHWHNTDHLYPEPMGVKASNWMLPVTNVDLIDVCRIGIFETCQATSECSGNQVVIVPDKSASQGEIRLEALKLHGHDLFTCRVVSVSDEAWRLSIIVEDAQRNPIAERILDIRGSVTRTWQESLPELFGPHTITLRVQRRNTDRPNGQAPAWVLPALSRAPLQEPA